MREESIQQDTVQIQDESEIVCVMCEGVHGNNTNCQRND